MGSHVSDKKRAREDDQGPLQKENGDLVTRDMEKPMVHCDYFTSFFTAQAWKGTGRDQKKEDLCTISKDQVQDQPKNLKV